MSTVTLDLPDDILLALKLDPEELGDELRLAAATKLYELGRLSSGTAARLAGVPRVPECRAWYSLRSWPIMESILSP